MWAALAGSRGQQRREQPLNLHTRRVSNRPDAERLATNKQPKTTNSAAHVAKAHQRKQAPAYFNKLR